MENTLEDIKRYDSHPDMPVFEKLSKNLRLVMSKADSKWVSGTDPEELKRVENWTTKNLGVSAEQANKAVETVAEKMKGERHKNRITFYYLVIHELGKMRDFAA